MKLISSKLFWQTFIWSSILLSGFAIYQTMQQASIMGITLWRSKWALLLGLFVMNIAAGAFGLRQLSSDHSWWIEKFGFIQKNKLSKWLGVILIAFGFSLVWFVRLNLFGNNLPQVAPVFWVFLWASILQVLGLKFITKHKWHTLFALIVLVQGLIYQIYGRLTIVTDYPFSIGYSEAGRHYYASMYFAKSLYNLQLPLPFLHPSRYFLLSLPFLFDGLPFWAHRLWQALLWIGLTAASAIFLARRLSLKGQMQFFVAAWAFLYFFQGAVYYHLHICVILILAGVSVQRPWRSLIFIILASVWAGVSRVNWFPVPAILAIAIYLLETSIEKKGWRYWLTPFIWTMSGIAAAVVSQFIYINVSGNADARIFSSSFTSELLWNRLLPNETFPLGILLGITLVSAPLIIGIHQMVRGQYLQLHFFRWCALLVILCVLFFGGLTVSVKIGGGADLHNMDAFLVLLAIIVTSFLANRVAREGDFTFAWQQIHWSVIEAALIIPIGFALPQISFPPSYDHVVVKNDIQNLQDVVTNNVGEILFVTERQLLTFDELNKISLVPEYEQSELMEMAISGNREYLRGFYSDLKRHRFAVIIAEEQKFTQQKKGSFIEENNAWVRYVGAPLLCAYRPIESLSSTNIQVFVPRPGQPKCKDPFEK